MPILAYWQISYAWTLACRYGKSQSSRRVDIDLVVGFQHSKPIKEPATMEEVICRPVIS